MAWCLPPQLVNKFREGLISGAINPEDLALMSSAERRGLLAKHLGEENAQQVNAAFESKLLLKNRQQGYISWATKMLGGESTPAGRDVISRVNRMREILDPESEQAFLNDLAAKKLGTSVSFDEAKKITDLSQGIDKTRGAWDEWQKEWQQGKAKWNDPRRFDYGYSQVDLRDYVANLKHQATRLGIRDVYRHPGKVGTAVAGHSKAIVAALDNSYIFRQGWKGMWTNPVIWQRNARQSFVNMVRQFGGKDVIREIDANVLSRPNSVNGLYKKMDLAVASIEETFPETIFGKVPGFGRVYKASEAAFAGQAHLNRADIADKMIDIMQRTKQPMDDAQLKGVGSMVNSLTSRGSLGKLEPVGGVVNNVLFSARNMRANIDLLLHPLTGAGGGNFVRKQAALNLLKNVVGMAAVLTIARALKPDSVELDPRSANFGKIRIGDTRFDVSGGMSSIWTLAARLAPILALRSPKVKSATTGEIRSLSPFDPATGKRKFDPQTGEDLVFDFFGNHLSPAGAVARDMLRGETRDRKPVTVLGEARQMFQPLPVTNYLELKNNPNSAPILAAMIADALGVGTNTYSVQQKQGRPTRPSRPSRPSRAVRP